MTPAAFNQAIGSWDTSQVHEACRTCSKAPPRSTKTSALEYLAGDDATCFHPRFNKISELERRR